MDRSTGSRWLKGFAAIFGLVLLASMLSFHLNDPSLTNLRYPHAGVQNLFGLPGALLGGSLVEFLGPSALALPIMLWNWLFMAREHRARSLAYAGFGATAMVISSSLHGLASGLAMPGLGAPGLAGLAGSAWVARTTGPWLGLLVLLPALAYALAHMFHAPVLKAAYGRARVFWARALPHARERLPFWRERLPYWPEVGARLADGLHTAWRGALASPGRLLARTAAVLRVPGGWRAGRPGRHGQASAAAGGGRNHGGWSGNGRGGAKNVSRGNAGESPAIVVAEGDPFDAWFASGKPPGNGEKPLGES